MTKFRELVENILNESESSFNIGDYVKYKANDTVAKVVKFGPIRFGRQMVTVAYPTFDFIQADNRFANDIFRKSLPISQNRIKGEGIYIIGEDILGYQMVPDDVIKPATREDYENYIKALREKYNAVTKDEIYQVEQDIQQITQNKINGY